MAYQTRIDSIRRQKGLNDLNVLLGRVKGTAEEVRFGYGDELQITVAAPQEEDKSLEKTLEKALLRRRGESRTRYVIGSRGSNWRLEGPRGEVIVDSESETAKSVLPDKLTGREVANTEAEAPRGDLVVRFVDGSQLTIQAADEEAKADERPHPHWEVLTPTGVVAAAPGRYWLLYDAHMPEDELPTHSEALRRVEEAPPPLEEEHSDGRRVILLGLTVMGLVVVAIGLLWLVFFVVLGDVLLAWLVVLGLVLVVGVIYAAALSRGEEEVPAPGISSRDTLERR